MNFIKHFNQIGIFVILVVIALAIGSKLIADAKCPADRLTYEGICDMAMLMQDKMNVPLKDSDIHACQCAR